MNQTAAFTVIAGAGSGIGSIREFAARGANHILTARHTRPLEKLRQEILENYPALQIFTFTSDLARAENACAFTVRPGPDLDQQYRLRELPRCRSPEP